MIPDSDDDSVISRYLDLQIKEASAQFDVAMHYANQAIAAERERCARIAESKISDLNHVDADEMARMIASTIRSSE